MTAQHHIRADVCTPPLPHPASAQPRRFAFANWLTILAAQCFLVVAAPAQNAFVDDAQRRVSLPTEVTRVFAAGAPAEVLLYTLVPDKLTGRNHLPSAGALELMPPAYRTPVAITNLPDRDDPQYDAELLALDVDVYVDYGTVDGDYVAALEAITARAGIPGIILDGALAGVPGVYRRLGAALGVRARGERLAAEAERILDKYRGTLTDVRVYLACSGNGLVPCLEGHSFGEAASMLGAINVGGSTATAARRPLSLDEIREREPDVVIAASCEAAQRMRADTQWQQIAAVAAGRIHAPPDVPFNWGPRPPSVNRLAGLIWLAYVARKRTFDEAFYGDMRSLFETFYHVTPTRAQLEALVAGCADPPGD